MFYSKIYSKKKKKSTEYPLQVQSSAATQIDLFCAILSPDRSPSDDKDAFLVCSSHMFHAAFLLIKGPHVALEYITCILNQPGIDSRATYSLLGFCNWKI